jgi:hypothetical protein
MMPEPTIRIGTIGLRRSEEIKGTRTCVIEPVTNRLKNGGV